MRTRLGIRTIAEKRWWIIAGIIAILTAVSPIIWWAVRVEDQEIRENQLDSARNPNLSRPTTYGLKSSSRQCDPRVLNAVLFT